MDKGNGPRVRPTASNRRRLVRRVDDVSEEPNVPDAQMEEGHEDASFNESVAEEMTRPIPSGPADTSLLSRRPRFTSVTYTRRDNRRSSRN